MSTHMLETLLWQSDGSPYSPRFDDVYRTRAGGLAQAQDVFMRGCGLPQSWRQRASFSILETGFGLGLNFLSTWALWQRDSERCTRLHFTSVEAYPVSAQALMQSVQALHTHDHPDAGLIEAMKPLAQELMQSWVHLHRGVQTWSFAEDAVRLTLIVDDSRHALSNLPPLGVDAIYLDGFSPSRNPDMWQVETLAAVTRHARIGTRLATYTVASQVRRDLSSLGYDVEKRPGLAPKRERLQAVWRGPEDAAKHTAEA